MLTLKIEKHLGRKVDFWSEVILESDGETSFIKEWNAPEPEPTIADLDKIDVTAEIELVNVHNNRRKEYPSVGDQLDMLMKDMKNNTTTHQTACEAVKAKYPKPE